MLFTFLEGYNYIFADIHGTSEGITGLCFLGIIIGLFTSLALVSAVVSSPAADLNVNVARADDQHGSYIVSGLGARKQEILKAGRIPEDKAVPYLCGLRYNNQIDLVIPSLSASAFNRS